MSPRVRAWRSSKFCTQRSLLITRVSPLPRLTGYSGGYSPSCPESSLADCSAGNPVRNPESYLACYSASHSAGHPERNSASCSESCRESNWEDSPSDCSENRRASNPQSNLPSSGAGNSLSYSESHPADSPACHPDSSPSDRCYRGRRPPAVWTLPSLPESEPKSSTSSLRHLRPSAVR